LGCESGTPTVKVVDTTADSPKFAGLVLTEFNPDHADEEGEAAAALVRGVMDAGAGKEAPERSDDPTDRERG
jgi:hypothetical protein